MNEMVINGGGRMYAMVQDEYIQHGITRRDWLAGMAMQGFMGSVQVDQVWSMNDAVAQCYRMADAMIAEGNK